MSCRLLYVIGQLRGGGSERQLYYLLKVTDRGIYRPEVVVWNFREEDTYVSKIRTLGVPIHSFPEAASRWMKLRRFRDIVVRLQPEVVHSYSFYTNFPVFWGTLGTDAIAVGGVRSDLEWAKNDAGWLSGRLSGRWPRKQIFNNSNAADSVRESKDFFAPKECRVVRNGLDLDTFRNLPLATNGVAQVVGVGSLFPVKRWDRLISAAAGLKQKGLHFLVRIAGDGPLRTSLKQRAEELGVSERIDFVGHSNDIPRLLAEATFLVHAADKEGCPNAVMEAMACGRAVVATDVGDVPSLVTDGKTGFVVRCGDNETLVERVATLISNRELCVSMGLAGRAKAELEFGLDRLACDTFAVYESAGWRNA